MDGDLNYRLNYQHQIINKSPSTELFQQIIQTINSKDQIHELLKYDQLNNQRQQEHIFINFQEGKITFKPTFKVLRHKTITTYNQQRLPAYCDRILWKSILSGNQL